jgi:hypothetical protein
MKKESRLVQGVVSVREVISEFYIPGAILKVQSGEVVIGLHLRKLIHEVAKGNI